MRDEERQLVLLREPWDSSQPTTDFDFEQSATLMIGDNKEAMRRLVSAAHRQGESGVIKLCYIDPPYNTGAEFSTYRDDSPVADWLQELRDRLVHVRALLTEDGSVWLHLDDRQQHHGRALLDEVFGADAFVATVVWQKRTSRDNRRAFSSAHDYIHVYAPMGQKRWKEVRNGLPNDGAFANPDRDPRGPWRSVPLSAQAGHATAGQFYTIVSPAGIAFDPPPGRCWTYSEARFDELLADGRIYWPRAGRGRPRMKLYADEARDLAPSTLWSAEFAGTTASAKREILKLDANKSLFDTPKPERLIERIVTIATSPGDLILDPYLGSGTTAVVASRLGRRYIGIERVAPVINEVALPRIRAAGGADPTLYMPERTGTAAYLQRVERNHLS